MKQLKYKKNSAVKILIVEDNVDTRNNIIEFLSKGNVKVLGADSIKTAMSIFNENGSDIDFFLIDLKLPDGNGMDFMKTVRNPPAGESNISHSIIISGFITEDVRRIGKQLGVIAYFEKPFDLYELREKINCAIGTNPPVMP